MIPVSFDRCFSKLIARQALLVVVENRKFVPGENVQVRLRVDMVPDILIDALEKVIDGRVKVTLSIAGNVDGTLDRQRPYTVSTCVTVAAHDAAL